MAVLDVQVVTPGGLSPDYTDATLIDGFPGGSLVHLRNMTAGPASVTATPTNAEADGLWLRDLTLVLPGTSHRFIMVPRRFGEVVPVTWEGVVEGKVLLAALGRPDR